MKSLICVVLLISTVLPSLAYSASYSDYRRLLKKIESNQSLIADDQAFINLLGEEQFIPEIALLKSNKNISAVQTKWLKFAIPNDEIIYDFLEKRITKALERNDDAVPPKGGRARHYSWYWGYYGRAAINMYSVTKKRKFLDLASESYARLLEFRDDRLELTDDRRDEIVPSWGTLYKNGLRGNEVTTAGLISLPACEFLQVVNNDPELKDIYAEQISYYVKTVNETLSYFFDEMLYNENNGGYFRHKLENYLEPFNHSNIYAAALVRCLPFSQDKVKQESVIQAISNYYKQAITVLDNQSYSWPYSAESRYSWLYFLNPNKKTPKSEAIWKAGVTIELPIAAHHAGIVFDQNDIDHIANVLLKNVVRDDGKLNRSIGLDGTRTVKDSSALGFISIWLYIPDTEEKIRTKIENIFKQNPEKFPHGWFGGARSMIMGMTHYLKLNAMKDSKAI